jgi:hypothetical protein
MSDVGRPTSDVRRPTSDVRRPTSEVRGREDVGRRTSDIGPSDVGHITKDNAPGLPPSSPNAVPPFARAN